MKLTEIEKNNLKEAFDFYRNYNTDITVETLKVADTFKKMLRTSLTPFIDAKRFNSENQEFESVILSLCAMITAEEIECLERAKAGMKEDLIELFLKKFQEILRLIEIKKEHPELFMDH